MTINHYKTACGTWTFGVNGKGTGEYYETIVEVVDAAVTYAAILSGVEGRLFPKDSPPN